MRGATRVLLTSHAGWETEFLFHSEMCEVKFELILQVLKGASHAGTLAPGADGRVRGAEYRVLTMVENHLYSKPAHIGPDAEVDAKSSQLGGARTALIVMSTERFGDMCRESPVSMRWRQKKAVALGTWCFPKLGRRSYEARHAHAKHAIGL